MSNIESQIDPETAAKVTAFFQQPEEQQDAMRNSAATSQSDGPKPAPSADQALRNAIAAKHGLSEDIRDLYLLGTDEGQLDTLAAALAARGITGPAEPTPPSGPFAPSEGSTRDDTPRADRDARQVTRDLFNS